MSEGPMIQDYLIMKIAWVGKHIGFWTVSAICGMNVISSRTSWKSWSWWWEAHCSRWPACKTASCSRASRWLPQAQVWALGQFAYSSTQTPKTLNRQGPITKKWDCQQSSPTKCIYENQALEQNPGQGVFSLYFYFYDSHEFRLK